MPGFEGEACETEVVKHSIIECASECLDLCMKRCLHSELSCYNNCTKNCNDKYISINLVAYIHLKNVI